MAQKAFPDAISTDDTWSVEGAATAIAAVSDELTPDAAFVRAEDPGAAITFEIPALSDPRSASGHHIKYRLRTSTGGDVSVVLMQGSTQIAYWLHLPAPADFQTFDRELTAGQTNSISNYSDLSLEVRSIALVNVAEGSPGISEAALAGAAAGVQVLAKGFLNAADLSLISQSTPGAFALDVETGEVTVAVAGAVDYEVSASETVTVSGIDAETSVTVEREFTIPVQQSLVGVFSELPAASALPNAIRLEKLRADYDEFAVFTPISADGIEWARWYFTARLNIGNAGCPRLVRATTVQLYAQDVVDRHPANVSTGTQDVTPTESQGTADATTRSGTWTASTTTSGVTDIRYSTVVGDYVEYTVTGATRIAHRAYANSTVGGIAAVSVKQGGVEVDASKKVQAYSGTLDLYSLREAIGHQVAYLAKNLNPSLTYVVRLTLDASTPATTRLYDGGLLLYGERAFDEVGLAGIYFDQANGTPLVTYGSSRLPGTVAVYELADATRVDWAYYRTSVAGIARVTLFNSVGTQVATEDIDAYNVSAARVIHTVAEGLSKGTYYLHVENLPEKNASSTRYQILDGGAISFDETTAGDPVTGTFAGTSGVSDVTQTAPVTMQGTGNVELAIKTRKAANAVGVGDDFVGGTHGYESSPASLTITLDAADISAAYDAAAAGAIWNGANIQMEFDTTLQFPDGGDFADVTYSYELSRLGYRTDVARTTLADAYITNEYVMMFQAPKDIASEGAFGDGFRAAQSRSGEIEEALDDSDASIAFSAEEAAFAIYNDSAVVALRLLNPVQVDAAFRPLYGNARLPFLQDRSDGLSKVYRDATANVSNVLVSSGHQAQYQRLMRIALR